MPGGLNYDESGTLAAYFGISFLSLLLFPSTFIVLRRAIFGSKKSKGQVECGCGDCVKKVGYMRRYRGLEGGGGRWFSLRNILLLLGWIAFAALAYIISQSEPIEMTVYNPYDILGLNPSSDEKAVKKRFRQLSLKSHPDKVKLEGNQTKEMVEAAFVEITKAYKSLTDETIRDNLRKFGNPDGQQPREDRIAIPRWVVEGKNGLWVLAVYGLVLGVGIPWLVGSWWFKQKVITKDGALSSTAELFFHHLIEDISLPSLLALISSSSEIRSIVSSTPSGKSALSKKEKRVRLGQTEELEGRVRAVGEELGLGDVVAQGWAGAVGAGQGQQGKGKQGVVTMNVENRRAVVLLWSHLLRIDDVSQDVVDERRRILLQIPKIFPSLLNVSVAYHWLNTTVRILKLYPQLVQATPSSEFPAVQLPGVGLKEGKESAGRVEGNGWMKKLSGGEGEVEEVEKLLGLGEEGRRVVRELPELQVTAAKFEVEGEPSVTPSSLCQLSYTVHLSALNPSEAVKNAVVRSKNAKGEVEIKNGMFAHAPRWPTHRKPHWWVLIADPTSNRILFPPQRIGDIPILSQTESEAEFKSTSAANNNSKALEAGSEEKVKVGVEVESEVDDSGMGKTFKLSFPAPPNVGSTPLEAFWISDSYVGCDASRPVTLVVENPVESQLEEEDDDDDISDPEEDSLAGQLAALKGQKVKKATGEHDDEDGDEDDDSSSDEEGPVRRDRGGGDSDTTTDSEDE